MTTTETQPSTKAPSATELQARYQGVVKMILHHPEKDMVQKRVTAHLRAITDGKLISIAMYHVAASIPLADKWSLYTQLASALSSNDWSQLQGRLGAGAKVAEASETPANDLAAPAANTKSDAAESNDVAQSRYRALVKIIASIGEEADGRVNAHIQAITDGKHDRLAAYHEDVAIGLDTKAVEYAAIARALGLTVEDGKPKFGKPDWRKLKEPAAAQETPTPRPPAIVPAKREESVHVAPPAPVADGDAEAAIATLRKLLGTQTVPSAAPIDEGAIRLIVNEELEKFNLHDEIRKANLNGAFPTDRVAKLIADAMASQGVRRVELILPTGEAKPISGLVHKSFETALKMVRSRTGNGYPVPCWWDGPPGGGKSHMMEQIAEALGLPHYILAIGPTDTKSAVVGSVATGEFRPGIAYEPYKNGGLLGIDEIAAGDPGVLVSTNSLVANSSYRFPNGELVRKHKDFHVVAADNTRGTGNVKGMIRNRLDAATLDRFAFLKVDYDEELEAALCGNKAWAAYVKKVRDYIAANSAESVYITPRASLNGAALLAGGLDVDTVMDATVFKFCSKDLRSAIIGTVGAFTV
jgi:hypothetical protein